MSITLVQSNAKGTAAIASGTFTVTLQQAPVNGNLLILCFAGQGSTAVPYITGISQTNVTWTSQEVCPDSNIYQDTEIWVGVVSASAGTVITITVAGGTGGMYGEIADVCEWSGLSTSGFLDKTGYNNGAENTATGTGTTVTTTQASELWIGCTGGVGTSGADPTQTNPTNGFTLLDGVKVATSGADYSSLAYLYQIVSSTGTANSGTTIAGTTYWTGCIATFKASATTTYTITASADANSSISPSGTVVVSSGANRTFNISANTGYSISHVYVDSVDQGAITAYTFSNVQAAHTISVSSSASSNQVITGNLTVDGNAAVNNVLSANTLSTTGNATIGNALSANTLSTTGTATIGGLATVNSLSVSTASQVLGSEIVQGSLSAGNITTNSASIGGITTANLAVSYSTTINGSAPDVLTPSPRYLPTMPTNLSGFPVVTFNNIKTVPSDPGVPQGAYYADASPQSLFLTEMQEMGSTAFIQFLATNYGLWVEKDISTYGALMTATDPNKGSGGGAIQMGHGFTSTVDEPQFILTDTVSGGSNAQAEINAVDSNGAITGLSIISQGSGYTFADVSVGGSGAILAPVIVSGKIQSITVINGGQNYSNSDTVNISGNSGATQAAAILNVNNGVITAVNVTNQGQNYTYANITVNQPGIGSGARLAPVIGANGTITGINIFSSGQGYQTSNPVYITNYPHNTLYLTTGTSPANLDLQNLTVHGNLTVQGQSNIGANLPLQIISGVLSILQASVSQNGFLSSNDWNTFNNKQNVLTIGNLNGTANQVNVSGGAGAIIGSGVTLSLPQNIDTSASPTFAGLTLSGSFSQTGGLSINSGGDILFYANNSPSNCQFKVASNGTSAFNLVWDITGNKSVLYVQRNSDGTDLVQTGSTILNDGYGNILGVQNLYANAYCINTNFGNLYGNTITNNPAYNGTAYVWELAGTGLIIDGCLNVSQISMNAGTLVLDNGDNKAGYIQFGKTLSSTARLAQVTLGGQTLPVLAIQSYVGSGGKFGAWDLGVLDASMIFVDHLTSASGGGIYFFDSPRLNYGSGKYVYLYDCNNSAGSSGQVLCVNSSGYPQWSSSPIFGNISCGTLSCGAISIGGNIIPTSGGSYYCGSYSYPWQIVDTQYLYCNVINSLTSGITIYGSGGSCGTSSSYWNSVYGAYLYYINSPAHFNEALHDEFNDKINFDLIRNFRKDDKDGSKIHPDCIKHLRNKEGFYDTGTMDGWHLSVQKIMVQKFDEHDEKFEALMKRIELLENQLKQKQAA